MNMGWSGTNISKCMVIILLQLIAKGNLNIYKLWYWLNIVMEFVTISNKVQLILAKCMSTKVAKHFNEYNI